MLLCKFVCSVVKFMSGLDKNLDKIRNIVFKVLLNYSEMCSGWLVVVLDLKMD